MNKNSLILGGIAVLVLAAVFGLAVWLKSVSPNQNQPSANIQGAPVFVRPYSHMTGVAAAKVTLVEFGDYQCPYCGQAYGPVKQVVDKYKTNSNFNFVFRNFPLPQHANAQAAAEAAEAAGAQGKYFEMEELLYQHQNDWSSSFNPTDTFASYAQQLGLDINKFKTEVASSKYIDNITQDERDGEALGVNGTPTFFLNGQKLGGYTQLDSQISILLVKYAP